MCLVLFALNRHPHFPLVLIANRDEFYDRPTTPMHWWEKSSGIIAGRDERSGGTWFGATSNGRFSAITNYRDPLTVKSDAPSRGGLVSGWLRSSENASEYFTRISADGASYNGFNLLFGRIGGNGQVELHWYSNRFVTPGSNSVSRATGVGRTSILPVIGPVSTGLHGLSNAFLDTPWPKVTQGVEKFGKVLDRYAGSALNREELFAILLQKFPFPDSSLPSTGIELSLERALSPAFIRTEKYGTRASYIFTISAENDFFLEELTWPGGKKREFGFRVRVE